MISPLFLLLLTLFCFEGEMLYLKAGCHLTEVEVPLELINSQLLPVLDVSVCFPEICLQCVLVTFPLLL